ncbi:MAG: hypothetical protein G3H99_04585 [Ferrovum sp.]|nr:hypothetical protein [Ferrovum sp.]
MVSEDTIGGKPVFVFERHNYALIPWARIARANRGAVRLLTLDYHTDTRPAFVGYACQQFRHHIAKPEEWSPLASSEIATILVEDDESVEVAVTRLRHDEHIDAAVRSGILDLAFVVANQDHGHIVSNEQLALNRVLGPGLTIATDGGPITIHLPRQAEPPFTYTIPDNRIVVLPRRHDYLWLEGDEDDRGYRDSAVDSRFLAERLELIDTICSTAAVPGLFERPFVLDIDLDYFNTQRSISPGDTQVFHDLIHRAEAITIARETTCVESCQLEGEGLTSAFLEQKVKMHIAAALAG